MPVATATEVQKWTPDTAVGNFRIWMRRNPNLQYCVTTRNTKSPPKDIRIFEDDYQAANKAVNIRMEEP